MDIQADIAALAPWFHNLHLPGGIQTAPAHRLGDFPAFKWAQIAPFIPADLSGQTVLDIGCNAGFYSFELARRGAQVTALDLDPHYLRQAAWAAQRLGLSDQVQFRQQPLYALAEEPAVYDLVWFMGVLYHLRYPLLALDIVRRLTRRQLVFQTLTVPGEDVMTPPPDLALEDRERLNAPGWPHLAFIERRLAGDPTNWWAANHAGVEALLRASGFQVTARPGHEIYLATPGEIPDGMAALVQSELAAATGRG